MAAAVRLWEVKQNTEEKNFYDGLLVNIFGDKTMLGPGFQIASHYAWIPSLIICQNYLHIAGFSHSIWFCWMSLVAVALTSMGHLSMCVLIRSDHYQSLNKHEVGGKIWELKLVACQGFWIIPWSIIVLGCLFHFLPVCCTSSPIWEKMFHCWSKTKLNSLKDLWRVVGIIFRVTLKAAAAATLALKVDLCILWHWIQWAQVVSVQPMLENNIQRWNCKSLIRYCYNKWGRIEYQVLLYG